MSTCPEKDILSLYIDNELPPEYVKQVEEHLASCEKCNAELKKFKILKSAFEEDSEGISFTQSQLEDSYDRLMVKMSYKKNALQETTNSSPKQKNNTFKYILSGAAAAAVVACIIPVRVSKSAEPNSKQSANYKPVARTQLVPQNSTQYGNSYSNTVSMPDISSRAVGTAIRPDSFYRMPGSPLDAKESPSLLSTMQEDRANLACYDVFGPRPDEMFIEQSEEKSKGFSLHFSSPIGNISLEIGN